MCLRYLFTLMVFGVNMTPTIYRVIVKNLYIFNNTNNISFFLFTSHLYINAVFWEIWSTFVPIYCKIPQLHI